MDEQDNTKDVFSKCLHNLRKSKDMTQEELANAAGMSTTIISDYENGRKVPGLSAVRKLANVLETSIDELCGLNASLRYQQKLEKKPVLALLTALKLFQFQVHVEENNTIVLSMAKECMEYSPNEIKKFFKKYEKIQEYANLDADDEDVKEIAADLILRLEDRFKHLPGLPVYSQSKLKEPVEK